MMDVVMAAAQNWLHATAHDVGRYVIFAVSVWLGIWVVFAKPLAGRKIRPERPPARQLVGEFLVSIRSIAIFSTVGLAMFFLERAGYLPGPELAAGWGPIWFWVSLGLMVIAHDAYFYWAHRLMHDPRLFRRFHRRHHKSMNPSPFTAYSFDLGEAAVMASFVPAWMALVPTPWPVLGLFMLHQIARNTIGHCGYEVMPARRDGRPALDWLTSVTHHDLHHAQAGWNYGLYFTWWDRLMGTEHPDYHARFAAAVRKPLAPAQTPRRAPAAIGALAALGLLAAAAGSARAEAAPAALAGDWATQGLGAVVRFEPCAEATAETCGRLVWAWNPQELKGIKVGEVMIAGLVWRDGAWRDGRLINPEDGRTYRGQATQAFPDGLRLRGCAGPICASQVWRRLDSIPRPAAAGC